MTHNWYMEITHKMVYKKKKHEKEREGNITYKVV